MQTNEITIPLRDGKRTNGQRSGDLKKMVLFVHGLHGRMDSQLAYTTADFLARNGYGCARFNLYSGGENGRNMDDCTIETHARDIDDALDWCREQGAETIYLLGHSLAAYCILAAAKKDVQGIILFDPSHPFKSPLNPETMRYAHELDAYLQVSGPSYIHSKAYVDSVQNFDFARCLKNVSVPVFIANAGAGVLLESGEDYVAKLQSQTEVTRAVIPNANHNFTDSQAREELFAKLIEWLKR